MKPICQGCIFLHELYPTIFTGRIKDGLWIRSNLDGLEFFWCCWRDLNLSSFSTTPKLLKSVKSCTMSFQISSKKYSPAIYYILEGNCCECILIQFGQLVFGSLISSWNYYLNATLLLHNAVMQPFTLWVTNFMSWKNWTGGYFPANNVLLDALS